jgi:hypothetical protein
VAEESWAEDVAGTLPSSSWKLFQFSCMMWASRFEWTVIRAVDEHGRSLMDRDELVMVTGCITIRDQACNERKLQHDRKGPHLVQGSSVEF